MLSIWTRLKFVFMNLTVPEAFSSCYLGEICQGILYRKDLQTCCNAHFEISENRNRQTFNDSGIDPFESVKILYFLIKKTNEIQVIFFFFNFKLASRDEILFSLFFSGSSYSIHTREVTDAYTIWGD